MEKMFWAIKRKNRKGKQVWLNEENKYTANESKKQNWEETENIEKIKVKRLRWLQGL